MRISDWSSDVCSSDLRKVVDGRVTDEVVYLSAMEEYRYVIAQANAELDDQGRFVAALVSCRKGGENMLMRPETIELVDVSPKQIVSVAAALIPFMEKDRKSTRLNSSHQCAARMPSYP